MILTPLYIGGVRICFDSLKCHIIMTLSLIDEGIKRCFCLKSDVCLTSVSRVYRA